jgi:alkylhydroperoxidase family enzyme
VRQQGNISQEQLQAFYEAGFTNQQYLDILVGYAQKNMSNYTNHIAKTTVDQSFQAFAWQREQVAV